MHAHGIGERLSNFAGKGFAHHEVARRLRRLATPRGQHVRILAADIVRRHVHALRESAGWLGITGLGRTTSRSPARGERDRNEAPRLAPCPWCPAGDEPLHRERATLGLQTATPLHPLPMRAPPRSSPARRSTIRSRGPSDPPKERTPGSSWHRRRGSSVARRCRGRSGAGCARCRWGCPPSWRGRVSRWEGKAQPLRRAGRKSCIARLALVLESLASLTNAVDIRRFRRPSSGRACRAANLGLPSGVSLLSAGTSSTSVHPREGSPWKLTVGIMLTP